jgi:phosphatidylserine decarboxylase
MPVRPEVIPFIGAALLLGVVVAGVCRLLRVKLARAALRGLLVTSVSALYFLYFFRDPARQAPADEAAIVAAADGRIAAITELGPEAFRRAAEAAGLEGSQLEQMFAGDVVRVSIFLSLMDVHVNRAPISGKAEFLGYFPGKHFFTFDDKSSDHNQHNSILIRNDRIACLVNQIVGPVCRRVVYWPDHDKAVDLRAGDRIGMMKFGSRLDMYLPSASVGLSCGRGDRVRAGETVIARILSAEEDT